MLSFIYTTLFTAADSSRNLCISVNRQIFQEYMRHEMFRVCRKLTDMAWNMQTMKIEQFVRYVCLSVCLS